MREQSRHVEIDATHILHPPPKKKFFLFFEKNAFPMDGCVLSGLSGDSRLPPQAAFSFGIAGETVYHVPRKPSRNTKDFSYNQRNIVLRGLSMDWPTAKTRTIKISILRMYTYEYVRTVYVYVVQVVRVRNSRSG